MADQNTVRDLVAHAWDHQREGRPDDAAAEFQKIVQQYPQDIDANYGLALAQKIAGQHDAAIKTFNHTLELVAASKKTYDASRDNTLEQSSIKTPEEDRFMMLSRMIGQRLAELQAPVQS